MTCSNLEHVKPVTGGCFTNIYGIPYQTGGRTVAGQAFPIQGIVIHCSPLTIEDICNRSKCATKNGVGSDDIETSYHYGIGNGHGGVLQFVQDQDISWTFGAYKNNTYLSVPPPNIPVNWPTLQGINGINVTPDVYTINIVLALGVRVGENAVCYECPTSSGLPTAQHQQLLMLLAYLAETYNIALTQDYITYHNLIDCGESEECPCVDIATLLGEVAALCPPCPQEAIVAPVAQNSDVIDYIYGTTDACCPSSPGCMVKVPFDACWIGDLIQDGNLEYIVGLEEDTITGKWCLKRGCIASTAPLTGCGTVSDPLRINLCAWGAYVPVQPAANMVNFLGLDNQGCLIKVPIDDIVQQNETPITVVDTNSINLTASGQSNHTLQADLIVSPQAGNLVQVLADGVYVGLTCDSVNGLFNQGTVNNITGIDTGGACVYEAADVMLDRLLCLIPESMVGVPTWLLGKTQGDCPIYVTPDSIVATGLDVEDTNTVNLTLTGNVIKADAIIDPAANNIIQATVNGLLVPDLTVQDTNCLNLTYANRMLSADLIISPAIGGVSNVLSCTAQGLYVPRGANAVVNGPLVGNGSEISPLDINFAALTAQDLCDLGGVIPAGGLVELVGVDGAGCLRKADNISGFLSVQDTNCVDLNLVAGVLTANPIISPTPGNSLQCTANGLYVPQGAGILVQDTNCINLTLLAGVITATAIVAPAQGGTNNALTCTAQGMYVPVGAGLQIQDTDCINLNLVNGVLSATPFVAGPQGGVANALSCVAGQGLYVPEAADLQVLDTNCINLTLLNGVLSADAVVSPAAGNQISCTAQGLYVPPVPGLTVSDTDCIELDLTGSNLTATAVIAPTQNGVPNALDCIPGQGLYVGIDPTGLNVFSITDDFANTQIILGGDVILFTGINGATAVVSASDTVTINGHMICAAGPPIAVPPYDVDQAWTYYDPNTGVKYEWNCADNKWETPAHITNATTFPTATTCATKPVINGVTQGVWTPGVSTYTIPAGAAETTFARAWVLTGLCTWAQVSGDGLTDVTLVTPVVGIPEATVYDVLLDSVTLDELGIATLPSLTIQQDGCYEILVDGIISYYGDPFESALVRASIKVNGVNDKHVADMQVGTLDRPVGLVFTIPFTNSYTQCLSAGDTIELTVTMTTNFGGQVYNLDVAGIRVVSQNH